MKNSYFVLNGSLESLPLHNIVLNEGLNEYLIDHKGKSYIDLNSGLWNVSLGYNPNLNEKISKEFSKILKLNLPYIDISSYYHDIYEACSKIILNFIDNPNYKHIIFTNSGSESLELALKLCKVIIKEKYCLSFKESYHGTYYGGMSLSGLGKDLVNNHYPDYRKVLNIEIPSDKKRENEILNLLYNDSKIGAFFIEPVTGSSGVKFPNISFYNECLKICREKNIITVFDEVATGFYRTGERFFFKHLEYEPDIICLSKSMNNGTLPVGCLVLNKQTEDLLKNKNIEHISTQNGNLLCLISTIETIKYYIENEKNIKQNIVEINKINHNFRQSGLKINSFGAMASVEISSSHLNEIMNRLTQSKVLVYPYVNDYDNSVGLSLFPPLTISPIVYQKVVKYIFDILRKY